MAQFRTTADLLDNALQQAGEVTNGNSPYETQVLDYMNRVHYTLVAGGTIPIGKDSTVEIDEMWPWTRAHRPIILDLQPKSTGAALFTLNSAAGVFSVAPTISLNGYFISIDGQDQWYRIASHTAASTAFSIDSAYAGTTGTGNYTAIKLDYNLTPSYIVIDTLNQQIQVQKLAGTTLTGTLTAGSYTPAALATHVAAVMTTTLAGPTVTGAYDAVTKLFSFTSDLAGATSFIIVGNGSQAQWSVHKTLGFDDIVTTSAATQTSTYILGGICRMVEPFKLTKSTEGSIYSVDAETMARSYPLSQIQQGVPTRFCVLKERFDETITVRFNMYPDAVTRIEIEYVPVPRDLKDDAQSIPLVPRKHVDLLQDAATFYLMLLKSDDRMQIYSSLVQGKLNAMISQHRGSLLRAGKNFGQIVPRRDLLISGKRRFDRSGGYT